MAFPSSHLQFPVNQENLDSEFLELNNEIRETIANQLSDQDQPDKHVQISNGPSSNTQLHNANKKSYDSTKYRNIVHKGRNMNKSSKGNVGSYSYSNYSMGGCEEANMGLVAHRYSSMGKYSEVNNGSVGDCMYSDISNLSNNEIAFANSNINRNCYGNGYGFQNINNCYNNNININTHQYSPPYHNASNALHYNAYNNNASFNNTQQFHSLFTNLIHNIDKKPPIFPTTLNSSLQISSSSNIANASNVNIQNSVMNSNDKNKININAILLSQDNRTTLMVKNIPNKYTLSSFVDEINLEFKNCYDVIYLPLDFVNKCNLGFAFINFVDPLFIIDFYETYRGKKWKKFNSEKKCELAYAKIQGKSELTIHFERGKLLFSNANDKKPLILPTPNPFPKIRLPISYLDTFLKIHPFAVYHIEHSNTNQSECNDTNVNVNSAKVIIHKFCEF